MEKKTVSSRPARDAYKSISLSKEQLREIRETLLRDVHEVAYCLGLTIEVFRLALASEELTIQVLEDRHGTRSLYLQFLDGWVVAPFTYVH